MDRPVVMLLVRSRQVFLLALLARKACLAAPFGAPYRVVPPSEHVILVLVASSVQSAG
jgi:hypothetical protein